MAEGNLIATSMETLIENILKACAEGDVNLLAACLQYGLDLNFATESDGLTPLMYAITYAGTKLQGDYYNVVNMLLEGGADTNSVDAIYNRTAAHWAAYCKQSDILFLLMSAGSDIAAVDIEGLTPFHISVTNNLYECVEVMIQSIPELVNYPTANGITPLMLACIEGHAKLCYLFLENGCEPNAIEPGTGQSSLHIAAEGGHAGIVGALLRYQVALDANDMRGLTPIHLACSNPTSDVLNIMCNAVGTTILELTDENGLTPLMHACINGSDPCVEFVVKKKANILYKESTENKTCLHWAVENSVCSPNIVRLLCRKKKQLINEVDVYGRTPLIAAAMNGHIEALKVLLEYSSDFYQTDNNQYSAIHWAVVCGQPTVLQELISCGCPINLIEKNGATSLHLAAQAAAASNENEMASVGALQCIEVLLNAGASLNVFDNEGRQPLHWALQCSENLEAVELLIKNGADPTSASYDGLTGLHMAAKYGITDNCQYLIEVAGVDGNITDQHSQTALFYAVESQAIDCCAYLLSIGLSANHKNKDGRSPVHIAATLGSIEALELLTTYNGDINAVNSMNVTPIHDAATNGQTSALSFLLRAGGNPNSPTSKVPSPLHYAVAEGYKDCAVLLLNAGADVNSYIVSEETGGPLTPLDYANDYPEIIEILQAKNGLYGKDITLPEVEEESTETVAEVEAAPIEDVIEQQDDEMKEKSSDTDSVRLRPQVSREAEDPFKELETTPSLKKTSTFMSRLMSLSSRRPPLGSIRSSIIGLFGAQATGLAASIIGTPLGEKTIEIASKVARDAADELKHAATQLDDEELPILEWLDTPVPETPSVKTETEVVPTPEPSPTPPPQFKLQMTAEERRMRKAKAQMDQSKSVGFRAVEELLKAQSTQSKLKRQFTMAHLKERSEEFRKEMLKNEEEEASKMNQLLLNHKKRMEKAMETSKKVNGEITEQLKSAHCVNTQVAKSMAELGISTRPTVSEWLKKKEDEKRNAMKSSLQSWQRTKSQRETAISLKQAITSHRALHHMAWSTKKDLIAQLQATKEPKPLQTQKIPSIKTKQSPEKPSIIKRQHAATVSGGCIRAMPIDYMKSSALLKHRSSKSLPGESSLWDIGQSYVEGKTNFYDNLHHRAYGPKTVHAQRTLHFLSPSEYKKKKKANDHMIHSRVQYHTHGGKSFILPRDTTMNQTLKT